MAAAVFSTDLTEILTQAAEAAAGIAGIYQSFKILDLAKDYYQLYKEQREFYYSVFQQGLEGPLALEVYSDPIPVLDYAGRVATAYDVATGPFGGKVTDVEGWWLRHANAYGALLDSRLQKELVLDIARVKSDWTNYLFRFEETYYDLRMDIRWRKRLALHNIGVKEGTAVSSAMNTSLSEYQNQIQDFGNQLATYGNGIAASVGYKKGLSDTADDFNQMQYTNRVNVPDYNYVQIGKAA
jgi:hypothetical protein